MITRKQAKKLIDLLSKQHPISAAEARECESAARLMALVLDIPVWRRHEGDPIPMDAFCTWYDSDPASIGALLKLGEQVWGWRWSTALQCCTDWSYTPNRARKSA
jgi:hypothetical protein